MNILLSASQTHTINILIAIGLMILSYIIGAIPFGLVIGKIVKRIDIRNYGSGNVGSTNAIRVLGKKVGFVVFFLDVFKGMAVIILVKVLRANGIWVTPVEDLWYGAFAIIGHTFSIFLGFKGGKAVATSLGVVLITCPLAAIACLIVFLIFLYTTGYVSLGSTFAALTVVTTGWILHFVGIEPTNFFEYFIGKASLTLCILFSVTTCLIIARHTKNYKRLLNGTENSFKKKKKENA
jgi:glycerol-3-phosphate acyltransferase PlsY